MKITSIGKIKLEEDSKDNYTANFGTVRKHGRAEVDFVVSLDKPVLSYRTTVSCASCTKSNMERETSKSLRCHAEYDTGIRGLIQRRAYFFIKEEGQTTERLITIHLKGEVQ